MQLAEELLTDNCPVCRQPTRQVRIERISIKRQAHQAGPNPMPLDVSVTGVDYETTFACDLVRSRMLVDGRWTDWKYDDERECRNAQRVVLDMQGGSRAAE